MRSVPAVRPVDEEAGCHVVPLGGDQGQDDVDKPRDSLPRDQTPGCKEDFSACEVDSQGFLDSRASGQ